MKLKQGIISVVILALLATGIYMLITTGSIESLNTFFDFWNATSGDLQTLELTGTILSGS